MLKFQSFNRPEAPWAWGKLFAHSVLSNRLRFLSGTFPCINFFQSQSRLQLLRHFFEVHSLPHLHCYTAWSLHSCSLTEGARPPCSFFSSLGMSSICNLRFIKKKFQLKNYFWSKRIYLEPDANETTSSDILFGNGSSASVELRPSLRSIREVARVGR